MNLLSLERSHKFISRAADIYNQWPQTGKMPGSVNRSSKQLTPAAIFNSQIRPKTEYYSRMFYVGKRPI